MHLAVIRISFFWISLSSAAQTLAAADVPENASFTTVTLLALFHINVNVSIIDARRAVVKVKAAPVRSWPG
jgi:hypothetical protein